MTPGRLGAGIGEGRHRSHVRRGVRPGRRGNGPRAGHEKAADQLGGGSAAEIITDPAFEGDAAGSKRAVF
jgi:hypothetical protein